MKGETPLHVATINGDMNHVMKLVEVMVSFFSNYFVDYLFIILVVINYLNNFKL